MKDIILCDFDGTITTQDTLVMILDRFAGCAWKTVAKDILNNEFGTAIGLKKEIALCNPKKTTREAIVKLLKEDIEIDLHFKPFLGFCAAYNYEFMIVSGGFSLCIDTILEKYGLGKLPYYANKLLFPRLNPTRRNSWRGPASSCLSEGLAGEKDKLAIEYPYASQKCNKCGNCKTMHLERYRRAGYRITYIGDSITDTCPAKHADLVFSKGHLTGYCLDKNIAHINYQTFADIQEYLMINNAGTGYQTYGDKNYEKHM
jgi:HAD superfamily phosphoserine phosphatase-like hydrolase